MYVLWKLGSTTRLHFFHIKIGIPNVFIFHLKTTFNLFLQEINIFHYYLNIFFIIIH